MRHSTTYRQPKILILYASYGEGHVQAASALKSALEKLGNDRTILIDLMAESHPWLNEVTRRFYHSSYTHLPYLYGWMYDVTKPMKYNSLFGSWLHSFGRHTIRRLLKKIRPDAVIYTFPLYGMPSSRKSRLNKIPSFAVMTDFDLHRRWVHPLIDRYYVATEDLRRELCQLGILPHAVQVSGIPVRQGFSVVPRAPELYRKYGLDPSRPAVLVMTGAQGVMPDVPRLCEALLRDPAIQLAVVCGRNDELRASLSERFAGHPANRRLHLYGFVETIHELMSLSRCLVTKPGGLTLAEAIAARLPVYIYRPVPGQERQNALYLASKGAAFIAYDENELASGVLKLIHHPGRLAACRENMIKLQAPMVKARNLSAGQSTPASHAAESIILDIISNIGIMERASIF